MNNLKNTRLNSFVQAISNVDGALIKSPSNKQYLLNMACDDAGIILVTKQGVFYIVDSRYFEAAKRSENNGFEVILQKNVYEQISEICSEKKIKTLCVENEYLTLNDFNILNENIKNIEFKKNIDASDLLKNLRVTKDRDEIYNIKCAQSVTDKAFSFILDKIKTGKTEKELALELEFFMRSNGAESSSFDIIFIAGKNTSLPHGTPSDYKIQNGDFINMDFGATVNGYKSDMTRTVAVGNVTDEQRKVYNIVLDAQKAAIEQIKEGSVCSEIDSISRDIIAKSGYGEYFGHALGHSVGLDIHEFPSFSPKCNEKLKESVIMTVEPGIYIPQKFGVRIEDMVLVTKNGVENLTKSEKTLIIL